MRLAATNGTGLEVNVVAGKQLEHYAELRIS
jgi:hypothetical protein